VTEVTHGGTVHVVVPGAVNGTVVCENRFKEAKNTPSKPKNEKRVILYIYIHIQTCFSKYKSIKIFNLNN
jgi:hypothetical protein